MLFADQPANQGHHYFVRLLVESPERLIETEDPGARRESSPEGDPLPPLRSARG